MVRETARVKKTLIVAVAAVSLLAGCSSSTPSPAPVKVTATTPKATAVAPTGLPAAPVKLASKAHRDAAAAILRAGTGHYRKLLTAGEAAWGTPAFGPWQQKTMMDLSYQTSFTKADKEFTAATEPDSINTWRDDIATAVDAMNQWAAKNTLETSDKASMPSAKAVDAAFAVCDRDASRVAAGK